MRVRSLKRVNTKPRLHRAWASLRSLFSADSLARFVISLVLAFALWAWVTERNDPEIARTLPAVQVTVQHLSPDLAILSELPTVEVRLQGPQSELQALESGSITAVVDASAVHAPGTYTLPVQVRAPRFIRVQDVVPAQVTVQIDKFAKRDGIPIQPQGPTTTPPNIMVKSLTVTPETVSVSGPQTLVNQVVQAQVTVQIQGQAGSFDATATPVVVDANGNVVKGVQIAPSSVTVHVIVDVRGSIRRVIPQLVGTDRLAPGYELAGPPTVLPNDEVVIDGPPDAVNQVAYLTTVPIDVSGLRESKIFWDVPLDLSHLPAGVQVDRKTVNVAVQVRQASATKTIQNVPVTPVNVRPGTKVDITPTTVSVDVAGDRPLIDALTAGDLVVTVDVNYAEHGVFQLPVRVSVPAGVQFQRVTPDTVQVSVSPAQPPATPAPTPTPKNP